MVGLSTGQEAFHEDDTVIPAAMIVQSLVVVVTFALIRHI